MSLLSIAWEFDFQSITIVTDDLVKYYRVQRMKFARMVALNVKDSEIFLEEMRKYAVMLA